MWQIKCDFDGTITKVDSTDYILEKFAHKSWKDIEEHWHRGLLSAQECLKKQTQLIQATPEDIHQALQKIDIDPFFSSFVNICKEKCIAVAILSDGYDVSIRSVLKRLNLEDLPLIANKLVYLGQGKFDVLFPYSQAQCSLKQGVCKCYYGQGEKLTLLIGDGRSDFCFAHKAQAVAATSHLQAYCQEKKIAHVAFDNFHHVLSFIQNFSLT